MIRERKRHHLEQALRAQVNGDTDSVVSILEKYIKEMTSGELEFTVKAIIKAERFTIQLEILDKDG